MIKIKNLNKYFYYKKSNEIHVVNNASITFPQTGLVTILGESGCGKTTLLNILGGLDDFHSGTIEYDDVEIKKYNSRKIDRIRNEKIGYIFQNYLLLQQKSVYENLHLILNMYDLTNEEKEKRIDYVLKAVGMMRYKKKNVSELSGGQQQRVAIARALIKSPSVILADEPTGNLDEKNTIQIMNIIKKISKSTLVILVSHERSIATSYSDYIVEISDGKIVNEKQVDNGGLYQRDDDNNIYLQDFQHSDIVNDVISIDFYSNENRKINLQIIDYNGRFYIKSSDDIILLDNNSNVQVLNEGRKPINVEQEVTQNDYNLEPLKFVRTPKLSFKEKIRLAFSNLNSTKKRVAFISFPLFLIIILTILSVQSVFSATKVDKQHLVYCHSNVYNLYFEKGSAKVSDSMAKYGFEHFYDDFTKNNKNIEIILDHSVIFQFTLPLFNQLLNKTYELKGMSILPNKFLDEKDLIYGRMPVNATEIVLEKWVIENAIKNSTLNNFIDVKGFLDRVLYLKGQEYGYKVVGVADTNENAVYMNDWAMFDVYPSYIKIKSTSVCSVSEFLKYNGTPTGFSLEKNTAVANEKYPYEHELLDLVLNEDKDLTFDVIDSINFGECPFRFVVPDNVYEQIVKSVSSSNYERMYIYCEDEEEVEQVANYLSSVSEFYSSGELKIPEENAEQYGDKGGFTEVKLSISLNSLYNTVMEPHFQEANKLVASRLLITITIAILSIVIVFFAMKSLSIKNMRDIGVYRAIGINKGSIVFVYALEIFIISLKTTLIGGILLYAITNIISGIPIIDMNIAISFEIFFATTIGMIALNVLVGIIPVILSLSKTPSQILTKYDI